jgi:hypothetical protein
LFSSSSFFFFFFFGSKKKGFRVLGIYGLGFWSNADLKSHINFGRTHDEHGAANYSIAHRYNPNGFTLKKRKKYS